MTKAASTFSCTTSPIPVKVATSRNPAEPFFCPSSAEPFYSVGPLREEFVLLFARPGRFISVAQPRRNGSSSLSCGGSGRDPPQQRPFLELLLSTSAVRAQSANPARIQTRLSVASVPPSAELQQQTHPSGTCGAESPRYNAAAIVGPCVRYWSCYRGGRWVGNFLFVVADDLYAQVEQGAST